MSRPITQYCYRGHDKWIKGYPKKQKCPICEKDRLQKYYIKYRQLIIEAKKQPCKDCNVQYPYYVMQFDHLRDKKFTIGSSFRNVDALPKEIAKCEVVCANCHCIRTHKQRGVIN